MVELAIASEEEPTPSDLAAVHDGLRAFNEARAGAASFRKVHLLIRDESGVVRAGLIGKEMWNWLFVETLWVDEALRGRGIGSRLLLRAEQDARERGRTRALLDTFEFQAPRFYERHGYRAFGVLEGFPPGSRRYYLEKDLV